MYGDKMISTDDVSDANVDEPFVWDSNIEFAAGEYCMVFTMTPTASTNA